MNFEDFKKQTEDIKKSLSKKAVEIKEDISQNVAPKVKETVSKAGKSVSEFVDEHFKTDTEENKADEEAKVVEEAKTAEETKAADEASKAVDEACSAVDEVIKADDSGKDEDETEEVVDAFTVIAEDCGEKDDNEKVETSEAKDTDESVETDENEDEIGAAGSETTDMVAGESEIEHIEGEIVGTLKDKYNQFKQNVVPKVTGAAAAVGGKVKDTIKDAAPKVKEKAENIGAKLKETGSSIAPKVKETADSIGAKLKETGSKIAPKVKETADNLGPKVKETADSIGPKVKETADNIGPKIRETADTVGPKVKESAANIGPKIKETAGKVGPIVKETAGKVGPLVKETAEKVSPKVKETARNISPKVKKTVKQVGPRLYKEAKKIGEAVSFHGYRLRKNIGRKIKGAIKSKLGIKDDDEFGTPDGIKYYEAKKRGNNKFVNHAKTVMAHRNMVFRHCIKAGIPVQGLLHDLSKFSPTEFYYGVKFYRGDRSPNEGEREDHGFSYAWMHHKGRNKHHFEYWTDYNIVANKVMPVKMPLKYVVEMFCDRVAASKIYLKDKYTNLSPYEYFDKGRPRRTIHPETEAFLEKLLRMLAQKGEDYTFMYIKWYRKHHDDY